MKKKKVGLGSLFLLWHSMTWDKIPTKEKERRMMSFVVWLNGLETMEISDIDYATFVMPYLKAD